MLTSPSIVFLFALENYLYPLSFFFCLNTVAAQYLAYYISMCVVPQHVSESFSLLCTCAYFSLFSFASPSSGGNNVSSRFLPMLLGCPLSFCCESVSCHGVIRPLFSDFVLNRPLTMRCMRINRIETWLSKNVSKTSVISLQHRYIEKIPGFLLIGNIVC